MRKSFHARKELPKKDYSLYKWNRGEAEPGSERGRAPLSGSTSLGFLVVPECAPSKYNSGSRRSSISCELSQSMDEVSREFFSSEDDSGDNTSAFAQSAMETSQGGGRFLSREESFRSAQGDSDAQSSVQWTPRGLRESSFSGRRLADVSRGSHARRRGSDAGSESSAHTTSQLFDDSGRGLAVRSITPEIKVLAESPVAGRDAASPMASPIAAPPPLNKSESSRSCATAESDSTTRYSSDPSASQNSAPSAAVAAPASGTGAGRNMQLNKLVIGPPPPPPPQGTLLPQQQPQSPGPMLHRPTVPSPLSVGSGSTGSPFLVLPERASPRRAAAGSSSLRSPRFTSSFNSGNTPRGDESDELNASCRSLGGASQRSQRSQASVARQRRAELQALHKEYGANFAKSRITAVERSLDRSLSNTTLGLPTDIERPPARSVRKVSSVKVARFTLSEQTPINRESAAHARLTGRPLDVDSPDAARALERWMALPERSEVAEHERQAALGWMGFEGVEAAARSPRSPPRQRGGAPPPAWTKGWDVSWDPEPDAGRRAVRNEVPFVRGEDVETPRRAAPAESTLPPPAAQLPASVQSYLAARDASPPSPSTVAVPRAGEGAVLARLADLESRYCRIEGYLLQLLDARALDSTLDRAPPTPAPAERAPNLLQSQ